MNENDSEEMVGAVSYGLGKVCEFLVNLMSSLSFHDGLGRLQSTNKGLLAEIDLFSRCLMEED